MRRDQKPDKLSFKGSGLPMPSRVAQAILDQGVDALVGLAVLTLPVFVVLPGGQGPGEFEWRVFSRHRR